MKLKLPDIPPQSSAYTAAKVTGELESAKSRRHLQGVQWGELAAGRLGSPTPTYLLGSRKLWTPERLSLSGKPWRPKTETLAKERGDGTVTFRRATGVNKAANPLNSPHHKQMFDGVLHDFLADLLKPPGPRPKGPIHSWAYHIQAEFGSAYEGDALGFYVYAPLHQHYTLQYLLFSSATNFTPVGVQSDIGKGEFTEVAATAPRLLDEKAQNGLLAVAISPGRGEGKIEEAAYVTIESDRERPPEDDDDD